MSRKKFNIYYLFISFIQHIVFTSIHLSYNLKGNCKKSQAGKTLSFLASILVYWSVGF